MECELPIRITVMNPPPDTAFAIQRGKNELLAPLTANAKSVTFELSVRISERKASGGPNVLGPYAQGTPDDRFIYVNSGTLAGQKDTPWTRRAKIKTAGISWQLIEQTLAASGTLEAVIDGRAKDEGPCCGTVPLISAGWTVCARGNDRARKKIK